MPCHASKIRVCYSIANGMSLKQGLIFPLTRIEMHKHCTMNFKKWSKIEYVKVKKYACDYRYITIMYTGDIVHFGFYMEHLKRRLHLPLPESFFHAWVILKEKKYSEFKKYPVETHNRCSRVTQNFHRTPVHSTQKLPRSLAAVVW